MIRWSNRARDALLAKRTSQIIESYGVTSHPWEPPDHLEIHATDLRGITHPYSFNDSDANRGIKEKKVGSLAFSIHFSN